MRFDYQHLEGVPFKHGSQDCYDSFRSFFAHCFDIRMPDYARPDNWWDNGMDLYLDHAKEHGFELKDIHPRDYRFGDVFAMSIKCKFKPVINHVAMYVGEGKIFHHAPGRFSNTELYKGMWREWTVATYRNRNVQIPDSRETIDLMTMLPAGVRERLG